MRKLLGLSIVVVLIGLLGLTAIATDTNQVDHWCATGIKIEPVDTPFVVPAPPQGQVWTLLVLKAGSGPDQNQEIPNPTVGTAYFWQTGEKDISHVILCYEPVTTTTTTVPEETTTTTEGTTTSAPTTTTTLSTTTSSSIAITTTTEQETTTSTLPVTTTTVTTDPTTTTVPATTVTTPSTTVPTTPTTTDPKSLPLTGGNQADLALLAASLLGAGLLFLTATGSWKRVRRLKQ